MKRFLVILLAVVLILGTAACGGNGGSSESEGTEDQITIGYACKNLNDTFQTYLVDAANEYAEENNIKLDIADAQNDVVRQHDQVNTFITQGVDALIVLPIDTSAAEPMTIAAKEAGIPLVYLNTNPYPDGNFPEGTYYVGSIEKEAGEMQAEFIGKLLNGQGNVCILQGSLTHEGAVMRSEGVVDKLKELYPDVKVLAKQPAEWQKDQGMSVTENWITAYGDIDAVFANNDEMALGAINALQEAGMTETHVIGIDGTKGALDAIKAGTLAGSVFQDAAGQAEGAMEIAAKAAKGEEISEQIKWIPFILITPENVDDFI
ncbi:sugar ABC transporter substrate-binding protein [Sinanaerobacter chloroacetimidivorans]|jgi:inositol transport system substrate-binding protein|uniref:Sugar ABC transporter substrate-binding protein n=1 Tax=Sinanaerobacter chloroacetimidivorans TaxID=2818044 RepID=A0A8J7W400_9FIRM|nr:sugar ABC transporter substrate-binding protein [Sinanaerobacter chloroacetimidivorans]MBR0599946.1 sugar ABC transporter substrate-binding protein [Sinanaerobacter chloroacetimidivorans]